MRHYLSYGNARSIGAFGYVPGHRKQARWFADRYASCRWLAAAYRRAAARVKSVGLHDVARRVNALEASAYDMDREAVNMRHQWRNPYLCGLVKCPTSATLSA